MVSVSDVYKCCFKWHQFVRNDEVQRLTGQPKLTAVVQSHRLTLFGHIAHMDNNADANEDPINSSPRGLKETTRTWVSTIRQDLRSHNLTLPEVMDMSQNQSGGCGRCTL